MKLWNLLLLPLLGMAAPAFATSIMEVPFPETVQDAPVIARGKIGASRVDFAVLPGGGKRIYTFYEFDIEEPLKGRIVAGPGTIREMGGEKGGVGMQVAGAAQFAAGEDVVALLSDQNSDGTYDIRGLMMGKLNIKRDESGREILSGPAISGTGDHAPMGGQPDSAKKVTWTLDSLRKLVKEQESAARNPQTSVIPSPRASEGPVVVASPAQASRLHNPSPGGSGGSEREEASGSRWPWLFLGAAIIALGIWLFVLRRL